ncbi:hypothetical protein ACFP3I_08165 [Chryseobacterium arachidis]
MQTFSLFAMALKKPLQSKWFYMLRKSRLVNKIKLLQKELLLS